MARKLDLRTGHAVWEAYPAPDVKTAPLGEDVAADMLVVGLGISGALVAEAASAAGLSVGAIDRRGPLLGSTAATTALAQHEIDQPLTVLAEKLGADKAERAWRRSRLALGNLQARIEELGIACAMQPRPSLYLAGDVLDGQGLRAEAEARRLAGLHAEFLPRAELKEKFGIDREGAVLSRGNLALDPLQLAGGMAPAAQKRGARFFSPVEAVRFTEGRYGVTAETAAGPKITAQFCVLATDYELADIVPHARHRIIAAWAIAARRQPSKIWPQAAFVWEASDPYLYLRATRDGRVICGGEDEDFSDEAKRDALIGEKAARIAEKLKELIPGLDPKPAFRWTGSFGTTETGLPIIGLLPKRERILAVMGYGGNGITYSRIAAEIAAAVLAGKRDRDADLYAF